MENHNKHKSIQVLETLKSIYTFAEIYQRAAFSNTWKSSSWYTMHSIHKTSAKFNTSYFQVCRLNLLTGTVPLICSVAVN